ncbi:MAG: hypothetical protein LUD17_09605, partial [Bacteroidales bacterium]|nr:hypothetical protein [Bacteroidales bacterium]
MKFPYFLGVVIIGLVMILSAQLAEATTTDRIYVTYREYAGNASTSSLSNVGLPEKSQRTSAYEGNWNINYGSEVPDSIKICIEAAAKLWATKIENQQDIYIDIEFGETDNNEVFIVDTWCQESNSILYPAILWHEISNARESDLLYSDVYITFNSQIEWNCSFNSDAQTEGYNMLTQALRAFALSLGFGSSVGQYGLSTDNFEFQNGLPTIFDTHLISNGINFTSLIPGSTAFKNFVESGSVFFDDNNNYKMYSPSSYQPHRSLVFLDNNASLMHYGWNDNTKWLEIDDTTEEILNAIGWETSSSSTSSTSYSPITIRWDGLDANGVGSAYTYKSFVAVAPGLNISTAYWRFKLKNINGVYRTISQGVSPIAFAIQPLSSFDGLYVNMNGDLEGLIEYGCTTTNGQRYTARPLKISLELKPTIKSISDFVVYPTSEYNYKLGFNVNYSGAEYLTVFVIEEDCSIMRSQRVNEPVFAHVISGEISSLYNTWVEIQATNTYGTTTKQIERLANIPSSQNRAYTTAGIEDSGIVIFDTSLYKTEIYTISGQLITWGEEEEELKQSLKS